MSATIVIDVDQPAVTSWARTIIAEGSLRIECGPTDTQAGHETIDRLAERAHTELNAAIEQIAESQREAYQAKVAQEPEEPDPLIEPPC